MNADPRLENHFKAIGRYESPEAEARARAAAMGNPPISQPPVSQLHGLLELCRLVNNGKAMKELQAACDTFDQKKRDAEKAVEESNRVLAGHDKERADHAAKLKDDQAAHDKKCEAAWTEIRSMQAETRKLNEQAQSDSAAAAKLKADLNARLTLLRQAGL